MRYTIYVFDSRLKAPEHALSPKSLVGRDAYAEVKVRNITFPVRAYIQRDKITEPPWLSFILTHCDIGNPLRIRNRSNSFIIALRTRAGRICALTYGHGFTALNRNYIQQDFGLDAACRLLDSNSIKEIESKAVGFDGLHKLQIASKPGDLATFPLQRTRDHVHRLGGTSNDTSLGKKLTGSTSCILGGTIAFAQLQKVCDRLVASVSKKPKARLAALKSFERVNDAKTVAALNGKLLAALKPRVCRDVGLFLPDAADWQRIEVFEASWRDGDWVRLDDLDIDAIVAGARATHGSSLSLEQVRIRGLTDGGAAAIDKPLSDLATFQTELSGKPFALKDGVWFLLDQNYVNQCKEAFRDIEVEAKSNYLPDWTKEACEGKYNDGIATRFPARFCSLDRKGVDADGNPVEVADLVTPDGHFIHVKAWKSSQTFSALIKQGQNSAQLIARSQPFRDGVLQRIPKTWRSQFPWSRFSAGVPNRLLRIVFAIADAPTRTLPDDLPFFSRLSLYDACAALRSEFFDVRVCHIVRKRRP